MLAGAYYRGGLIQNFTWNAEYKIINKFEQESAWINYNIVFDISTTKKSRFLALFADLQFLPSDNLVEGAYLKLDA